MQLSFLLMRWVTPQVHAGRSRPTKLETGVEAEVGYAAKKLQYSFHRNYYHLRDCDEDHVTSEAPTAALGILEAMIDEIQRHDGVLLEFIGDALMAIWNAPAQTSTQPSRRCFAPDAVPLKLLNPEWRAGVIREKLVTHRRRFWFVLVFNRNAQVSVSVICLAVTVTRSHFIRDCSSY